MSAVNITIQALLAAAGVTALVGQRITPDLVPQDTARPCIRVYLVSEAAQVAMDADYGPYMARVTVEVFSETATAAHAVAEAVKAAFAGVRNATILTKTVSIMKTSTDMSAYDDVSKTFRRATDYMVGWK